MRSCKAVRQLIRERIANAQKARALTRAAVQIAPGKRAQVVRAVAPCALLLELGQVRAPATNVVHGHRIPMPIIAHAIQSVAVITNRSTKKAATTLGRARIALRLVAPMRAAKRVRPLAEPMPARVLRGSARRMWVAAPTVSVHVGTRA